MVKTVASFVAKNESGLLIKVSNKNINFNTLQLILSSLICEPDEENIQNTCGKESNPVKSNFMRHVNDTVRHPGVAKHATSKGKRRKCGKKDSIRGNTNQLFTRMHQRNEESDSDPHEANEGNVARKKRQELSRSGPIKATLKLNTRRSLRFLRRKHWTRRHMNEESDLESSEADEGQNVVRNKRKRDSSHDFLNQTLTVSRPNEESGSVSHEAPSDSESPESGDSGINQTDTKPVDGKQWPCEWCKKTYKKRGNLNRHTICCHSNEQNQSNSRGADEDQIGALNKRQDMSTYRPNPVTSKPGRGKRWRCEDCKNTFSSKRNLNRHIIFCEKYKDTEYVSHEKSKPNQATSKLDNGKQWPCTWCETTYIRRCALERHISQYHQNEQNASLSCETDEGQNDALNKRQMSVSGSNQATSKPSGSRQWYCKRCKETFSSKYNLNLHKVLCQPNEQNDSNSSKADTYSKSLESGDSEVNQPNEQNDSDSSNGDADPDSSEINQPNEQNDSDSSNADADPDSFESRHSEVNQPNEQNDSNSSKANKGSDSSEPGDPEVNQTATKPVDGKQWPCEWCKKTYTTRGNLNRHTICCHSNEQNQSNSRGADEDQIGALEINQPNEQNDSDSSKANKGSDSSEPGDPEVNQTATKPVDGKQWPCEWCKKTYTTRGNLNRHTICCHSNEQNQSNSRGADEDQIGALEINQPNEQNDSDSSNADADPDSFESRHSEVNQQNEQNDSNSSKANKGSDSSEPEDPEVNQTATKPVDGKQWPCEWCKKTYTTRGNLNRHTICCHQNEQNEYGSREADEGRNVALKKRENMSAFALGFAPRKYRNRKYRGFKRFWAAIRTGTRA